MNRRSGAFGNIAWMSTEPIARLLLQFFVAVVVIRYLGPRNFGFVATIASITFILAGVQNLGFDSIVMDATDDEEKPGSANRALVTSLISRATLGAFFAAGLFVASGFVQSEEMRFGLLVSIAVVVAMPLDTFRLVFDLRRQSRTYVIRRIAVIVIHVLIQITLVIFEADVLFFLAANAMVAALLYVVAAPPLPRIHWTDGFDAQVLKRALPLVVTTVASHLYMRIDTVMLTGMRNPAEAGIYSAAVQIAEVPIFLPVAIGATFFLELRTAKHDPAEEQEVLTYTMTLVTATVGIAVVLLIALGPLFIPLILGDEFQASTLILVLYAPSVFFFGWGVIRHRWLVVKNLERHAAVAAVIGGILNIALNLALIPALGAIGATIATLISYAVAMYGYSLVVPECRPSATAIHRSFARAPAALGTLLKSVGRDRA